jgi:hypothetical protein
MPGAVELSYVGHLIGESAGLALVLIRYHSNVIRIHLRVQRSNKFPELTPAFSILISK